VAAFITRKCILSALLAHLSPQPKSSVPVPHPIGYPTALVQCQWFLILSILNGKPDVYKFHDRLEVSLKSRFAPVTATKARRAPFRLYLSRRGRLRSRFNKNIFMARLLMCQWTSVRSSSLQLESSPFRNALACALRIVLDAGAISYLYQLKEMADAESASCP
jgi:hypothetical protein